MKRFEYRVLDVVAGDFWSGRIDAQELTDKLNVLGREGWEAVSVVDKDITGGGLNSLLVLLKREIL